MSFIQSRRFRDVRREENETKLLNTITSVIFTLTTMVVYVSKKRGIVGVVVSVTGKTSCVWSGDQQELK